MKALAVILALIISACTPVPQPLPQPLPPQPPRYHAVGTEPFWDLSIDDQDIIFTLAGTQPVRQPTPKVIIGIAGEIYRTPRINVNIVHGQCSDGMSDRVYPDKAQADIDGKRFNGCGGL